MSADVRVPNDLVSERGDPEIVDVFDVILRDVDSVHVHENVADHDHGSVVILPRHVERVQKVIVQRSDDVGADFVDEMLADDLAESRVELLAVLVEHHGVGVPIEFFEGETAVVLLLDLLDGVPQQRPDVVDVFLVHRHGERTNAHFRVLFSLIHDCPKIPAHAMYEKRMCSRTWRDE